MIAGYDGSIRIRALLNHDEYDRGIQFMNDSANDLKDTLMEVAGAVGIAFGIASIVNFGKESVDAASALGAALLGLQSIVEGQGQSFKKANSFINDYISDGLVPLTDAVTAYKNLAARGYDDEQIKKVMVALKDAAAFGRQSSYTLGEAVATATEGLKNENSILVDNAGVTKNVAKMWEEYAKSIGASANNLTQAQKIQAEINGILEETRFQAGDAAKLVNTYSGQVAMLGFNFQQLKVQVGTALMPIVQAVLPGINAIISALLKLAKVFSQVTALLFGKPNPGTVGQVSTNDEIASSSISAADATDQLADATKGAGQASKKAAKDMKGVLASFDELNILADNASDSMGGIGGVDSGIDATMPELELDGGAVEEIGEQFKSLGEIFRDTLDEMLAGIPTLQKAFLDFASNFNDFNQKLYDAFKFDGVLERMEELGRQLAKSFNILADAIDWELWGRTLGAGLNLGLQFLTEFIYEFDWINLGKRLADFINGLVYEVDWHDFGRLLWTKFKIALETFAGFIIGLDMPALAQAGSNIVMGFFDEMKNTIAKIDWTEIGRQVARFISNIDWIGILSSVWGAVKEAVLAGFDFLEGVIEEGSPGLLAAVSVLAGVLGANFAASIVPEIIHIGTTISSVFRKIYDVSVMLKYGMADLSGAIKAVFGPGSVLAGIGTAVAGLALAFTNFFSMLKNGFNAGNEALMLLGAGLTAVGAIILGAPAVVAGAIAGIVAAVATAVVLIKEHWEEIKDQFSDTIEAISGLIETVKKTFLEWYDTIKDGWNHDIAPVIQEIAKKFGELVEECIAPLIGSAMDLIGEIAELVKAVWDNILAPLVTWFIGTMAPVIGSALELVGSAFNTVLETVAGVVSGILEALGGVIGFLTGVFSGNWRKAWEGIKDIFKGIWNVMVSIMEGAMNLIVKALNWVIGKINILHIDIPDNPITGPFRLGFNIPKISSVTLPRLANGAVIPPNQQFAAILGDQRSGKNLEAPADLIRQMVSEGIQAAMSAGGGNSQPIQVNIMLDRKVLARAMVNEVNDMTRSAGKPVLLI